MKTVVEYWGILAFLISAVAGAASYLVKNWRDVEDLKTGRTQQLTRSGQLEEEQRHLRIALEAAQAACVEREQKLLQQLELKLERQREETNKEIGEVRKEAAERLARLTEKAEVLDKGLSVLVVSVQGLVESAGRQERRGEEQERKWLQFYRELGSALKLRQNMISE